MSDLTINLTDLYGKKTEVNVAVLIACVFEVLNLDQQLWVLAKVAEKTKEYNKNRVFVV